MLLLATWAVAAAMALGGGTKPVIAPITSASVLDAPTRHVRTTDRALQGLLRSGYTHSPTFAALMARLERSDVYVYLEAVPRLPGALEGRLLIQPQAHGVRYVRIQIALRGEPKDAIALIGHELHHAVEVADAPEVFDSADLAALYRRIGIDRGNNEFDTLDAQEAGRRVRRELIA